MRQKTRTLTALTADPNGIVTSTATTAATPFTLLVTSLDPPRRIAFVANGAIDGTIAIVGSDRYGNAISESVSIPSTDQVLTRYVYASITSITPSDTDVNTVEVGWDTEVISAPVMLDHFRNPFNVSVAGEVLIAAADYTIQHTFKDLQNPTRKAWESNDPEDTVGWFPHASIAAESANADGNYAFPVEAVRLVVTAGSVRMTVMQAGPRG